MTSLTLAHLTNLYFRKRLRAIQGSPLIWNLEHYMITPKNKKPRQSNLSGLHFSLDVFLHPFEVRKSGTFPAVQIVVNLVNSVKFRVNYNWLFFRCKVTF